MLAKSLKKVTEPKVASFVSMSTSFRRAIRVRNDAINEPWSPLLRILSHLHRAERAACAKLDVAERSQEHHLQIWAIARRDFQIGRRIQFGT